MRNAAIVVRYIINRVAHFKNAAGSYNSCIVGIAGIWYACRLCTRCVRVILYFS